MKVFFHFLLYTVFFSLALCIVSPSSAIRLDLGLSSDFFPDDDEMGMTSDFMNHEVQLDVLQTGSWQAVLDAIGQKKVQQVVPLLEQTPFFIDYNDGDGNIFHHAAACDWGSDQLIQLCANQAVYNQLDRLFMQRDTGNYTPLMVAVCAQNLDATRVFIDHGAPVDAVGGTFENDRVFNGNILHLAAYCGWNREMLRQLCLCTRVQNNLKNLLEQRDTLGRVPLLCAIAYKNIDVAMFLSDLCRLSGVTWRRLR